MAVESASLGALQVEVRVHWLVPWVHVSPVLGVMVGVNEGEHCMVHVSVLGTTADIEKLEFHCLSVRRHLAHHAGPIPCITIMGEEQAVPVQIKHGDRIVGSSISRRLMHDRVAHGSHAERDLRELAFYVGCLGNSC